MSIEQDGEKVKPIPPFPQNITETNCLFLEPYIPKERTDQIVQNLTLSNFRTSEGKIEYPTILTQVSGFDGSITQLFAFASEKNSRNYSPAILGMGADNTIYLQLPNHSTSLQFVLTRNYSQALPREIPLSRPHAKRADKQNSTLVPTNNSFLTTPKVNGIPVTLREFEGRYRELALSSTEGMNSIKSIPNIESIQKLLPMFGMKITNAIMVGESSVFPQNGSTPTCVTPFLFRLHSNDYPLIRFPILEMYMQLRENQSVCRETVPVLVDMIQIQIC